MGLQITHYSISLVAIVSFLILGIWYIWIYRKGYQDLVGIVVLVLSIIWIISFMMEQSSASYQMKIFWNNIQYTGSIFLPVSVFLLASQYVGFKKLLRLKYALSLSILPIIVLFLIFTNELHHLAWVSAKLVMFDSFSMIVKEYNIAYFAFNAYSNILMFSGIVLVLFRIIGSYIKPTGENRWKNYLLIPYLSIPWIIILIKTLGFNPFPALEEMPIIIAVSTIAVIATLNRTKVREIMPMAFETVFESMSDGLVLLDKKEKVLKINPASQKIFNISVNKIDGKPISELMEKLNYSGDTDISLKDGEIVLGSNGKQFCYNSKLSEVKSDRGKPLGKVVILRDVTEMKKAEEDIKFLSFHDRLTGLNNRAYFDNELERLDTQRQLPLSLIVGDVNGLKLINDSFGHIHGDILLKKIADILRLCFRGDDIISRWGGDEFSIILPRTSYSEAVKIIDRVYESCKERSTNIMPLSMSMGAATKEDSSKTLKQLSKEAEDNMYQHKMTKNQSVRSSIINSLVIALQEKDYETEEHTKRMAEYATQFGLLLNLPDSKIVELKLLATLHDIGKIAIPDHIMLKPGSLTKKEWETMKKHSEIGYRIALSSTELGVIAKDILHHHEKWDGTGYPYGLVRDKIPLFSRVISVIDAYDAMTHDRPYRKAFSIETVMDEFKKCKGSQFDPELLDVFIDQVLMAKNKR
jgi:diguanylate cyclase (GGDEF)-like protein/PAS domain S-box-containing protein